MLQKEMAEYWSQGSQNYDRIIRDELQSFRPDRWQKLILGQAPKKKIAWLCWMSGAARASFQSS
ncbi:hypothetical protein [Methanosarcina horonobensis]|uniref:hypothetical protein n=1 Tax=Methanosarcina horonobensis TaxID=418008 RepID=UPI00373FE160